MSRNKDYFVAVECKCGAIFSALIYHLLSGNTKSCGCLQPQIARKTGKANYRHGHTKDYNPSRTYNSWIAMRKRCMVPSTKSYEMYGRRGIKVCERWLNSFKNFLIDMGKRPMGTSLDRINNEGNYELGNCRWATYKEQRKNQYGMV